MMNLVSGRCSRCFLDTKQQSLLFQIDYPEITDNIVPKHRFMSGFEQHVEAPDRRWQYLLFAAEPYETIAFKVRHLLLLDPDHRLSLDSQS